jgi:hypothetical protein
MLRQARLIDTKPNTLYCDGLKYITLNIWCCLYVHTRTYTCLGLNILYEFQINELTAEQNGSTIKFSIGTHERLGPSLVWDTSYPE